MLADKIRAEQEQALHELIARLHTDDEPERDAMPLAVAVALAAFVLGFWATVVGLVWLLWRVA